MESFKVLNRCELMKMSDEDRIKYQKEANEYFGNLCNQLKDYEKKEIIQPLLLAISRLFFVRIIKLNELKWPKDNGAVIFSVNHSNSKDFPVIKRLIKEHFFIMADYTMQNDFVVNLLNKLNSCIYVDRMSKKSGQNAIKQAIDGVNKGYNMAIFCESTWNLLRDEPMLPRKWGDLKVAQQTGRPIIPIVLDYNGINCFVKFGNPLYVKKEDDIKDADSFLFNEMTRLKKEIWESDEYKKKYKEVDYEKWLKKTIRSYKGFDVEYEISQIRKDDDYFKEEFDYILKIGEEVRPIKKIEKKLKYAKVNYRLK